MFLWVHRLIYIPDFSLLCCMWHRIIPYRVIKGSTVFIFGVIVHVWETIDGRNISSPSLVGMNVQHGQISMGSCNGDVISVASTSAPGGWINIKMPSYQYRKSHCGDKTILRPSHLHNEISYTGKTTSLYWLGAQKSLQRSYLGSFTLQITGKSSVCAIICPCYQQKKNQIF